MPGLPVRQLLVRVVPVERFPLLALQVAQPQAQLASVVLDLLFKSLPEPAVLPRMLQAVMPAQADLHTFAAPLVVPPQVRELLPAVSAEL